MTPEQANLIIDNFLIYVSTDELEAFKKHNPALLDAYVALFALASKK